MNHLFSIAKNNKVILRPECVKLCTEFSFLTEKEMLCVILAYDYWSIYRQFPEDERQRRARAHVFGNESEKIFLQPKIQRAVEAYKSLQYDPRREQIASYERKLTMLNAIIDTVTEDELKKLKDVITTSKDIRKAIEEIQVELYHEEENSVTETDENIKLSFLEKLQNNKNRYLEVTTKKLSLKI